MGIELFNNNRPKIWKVITGDHLLNHDDNNALLAVNSAVPVTLFVSNILPAGFSTKIIQIGAGSVTIVALAPVTLASAQGVTTTAVANDILTVSSHLPNQFICEAAGSLVAGGGGTANPPRKYTSANFTDATNIDDPWLVGKPIAIFWNNIAKFMEPDEWDATATGIEIIVAGFNSATDNPTFYIYEITNGAGGGV